MWSFERVVVVVVVAVLQYVYVNYHWYECRPRPSDFVRGFWLLTAECLLSYESNEYITSATPLDNSCS